MKFLENKTVWLTGASSGIGEALAKELAQYDCQLVISARNQNELERVKAEITENSDVPVEILLLDLTKPESFPRAVSRISQVFGDIDILINNAGVSQRSLAVETEMSVYRKLMEVNYFGTILLTKAVLPGMLERKRGHIVTISSIAGKLGTPWRTGYSASKHALHGFFDSLRAEVHKQGIKITIIAPGFIRTEVSMHALTGSGEPLGKMDEAQSRGISPVTCARKIVHAIRKGKNEVLIGRKEILAAHLQRFAPGLLTRIIRNVKVR